jgi:hypothetical protein
MSRAAEELPQDLWAQILQNIDYKHRLSQCALVCHKLARAAAAAAATQSLDLSFSDSPERANAFLSWTMSHGSSLTRLVLSYSHSTTRQLPCANLLELQLSDCSVQLCASSEHLGLLHSCTALTHLDVRCPALLDCGAAGEVPVAVAQLRHLQLTVTEPLPREEQQRICQALQERLLLHLTSLTCLHVDDYCNFALLTCFPPHISTIASLQQLKLHEIGED